MCMRVHFNTLGGIIMKKFYDVFFAAVLFTFVLFIFSLLFFEQKEAKRKEKVNAAYNLLDAKGGIARFPELAVVDLKDFGGEYSDQGLVSSYRTKKHILIDPVTGDLYVAIRTCTSGAGIFKVDSEGKILQEYSREEFYKLGVVDRLVK